MDFKIVLEPDVEDGGFIVHVPALPGCFTQGDTREEAIKNAREAIEAFLESVGKDYANVSKIPSPEIVSLKI